MGIHRPNFLKYFIETAWKNYLNPLQKKKKLNKKCQNPLSNLIIYSFKTTNGGLMGLGLEGLANCLGAIPLFAGGAKNVLKYSVTRLSCTFNEEAPSMPSWGSFYSPPIILLFISIFIIATSIRFFINFMIYILYCISFKWPDTKKKTNGG